MRNELDIRMVSPMHEQFSLATDEGPFHGGDIDSDAPLERQIALIHAARKGCFIEQTLGQGNRIAHKLNAAKGWITVD